MTEVRIGPSGPVVDVPGGTVLPDGAYYGQPLCWDGSAWVPFFEVRVGAVVSKDGSSANIPFPDATPGFPTVCQWFVESANIMQVERDNVAFLRRVTFIGETINPLVLEAPDAGAPRAGFFGATPVAVQSITGATTQDQVDSLVAALVAFGMVTDDR